MKYRILQNPDSKKYRVEIYEYDKWRGCEVTEYSKENNGIIDMRYLNTMWFENIIDAEKYAGEIQNKYFSHEDKIIKNFEL